VVELDIDPYREDNNTCFLISDGEANVIIIKWDLSILMKYAKEIKGHANNRLIYVYLNY
jgi:hypothetical protein